MILTLSGYHARLCQELGRVASIRRSIFTSFGEDASTRIIRVDLNLYSVARTSFSIIVRTVSLNCHVGMMAHLLVRPNRMATRMSTISQTHTTTLRIRINLTMAARDTSRPLTVTSQRQYVRTSKGTHLILLMTVTVQIFSIMTVTMDPRPRTVKKFFTVDVRNIGQLHNKLITHRTTVTRAHIRNNRFHVSGNKHHTHSDRDQLHANT